MFRIDGVTIVVVISLVGVTCAGEESVVTSEQLEFFETNIRPVLVEHCFDCHTGDNPESDLVLSSRAGMLAGGKFGPALRPGKPNQSLLISAIRHDEFIKMPPKEKLSTTDVVNFTQWVEMGAPWPDTPLATPVTEVVSTSEEPWQFNDRQLKHWAFQSVGNPQPPSVDSDWPKSPLDQFIFERLAYSKLLPSAPADRRTLIRRATYDIIGLPPTSEETAAFLADDSPGAFARVVDRLLDSPRYGEHWGRHWLDVARYADSNGLDENLAYANAYHYRDYVISAFNTDKPYARFVQEQIAGDLLPEVPERQENMNRYIATGFLALGPKMLAEDDPVKMQMDIIDEQLNTLGQTFMGLTIGCARCHDHKFDPLPAEDYYSLAGIFKSSKTMENHKVVAVWYERQLASQMVLDQIVENERKYTDSQDKIDQYAATQRGVIAQQMQAQFADYLLAANELQQIQQQRMPRRPALARQDEPFDVKDGVAIIEAEAFHRGDVECQTTGYGEGIGVVVSHRAGFVEFDINTAVAGPYQLELRFAAKESRPVQLFVNGTLVDDEVAGQVTGSWNPDGQRWFPGGGFELRQGGNTIRLYRDGVYPHLDRLVFVSSESARWQGNAETSYLSQIAARYNVNLDMVEVWRAFFERIRSGSLTQFPSFAAWLEFTELDQADFTDRAAELLRKQSGGLVESVRQALIAAQPQSLPDVAAVCQTLLATARESLPKEWFSDPSPLSGPTRLSSSYLAGPARQKLKELYDERLRYAVPKPELDVAMGVTEGTPEDLRIHLRGSHIALGKVAPRRVPRFIGGLDSPSIDPRQSGRLQLAQWLTDPDHPLFWRVMVNRVWHWRFGRGLTTTVDNFGLLGQPPTHPALLDWLTRRFIEGGGSLKRLHRMMMLSSTYQMGTQFDEVSSTADPHNDLLWRFRRRRLTAEEMRDSMIVRGCGLDMRMGGSLLKVKNRKYVNGVRGSGITNEFVSRRRSVFLPVIRSSVFDVLQAFDFPDPAVPAGIRQTSTVAAQALMLLNSDLAEEQTLAMAKRLLDISDDRQRVVVAFGQTLNREPDDSEIAMGLTFVGQIRQSIAETEKEACLKSWQSYCRVLLSSNEFAHVE